MRRENLKWEAPTRGRVLMRGTGAESLVVVRKAL